MKQQANGEIRTGFYICHCGHNIAAMVDCPDVAKYVEKLPGVALSRDYKYMCSAPGPDRKSTRLNSSHFGISYAVFCLKIRFECRACKSCGEFTPRVLFTHTSRVAP